MKKYLRIITLAMCMILAIGGIASSAAAYSTYTNSIHEKPLMSPDAYSPYDQLDSLDMGITYKKLNDKKNEVIEGTALNSPTDLFVDKNERVYIADKENSRIVVLDKYYKFLFQINEFYNGNGVKDKLYKAEGLYVTANNEIYVADTENYRIVVFDYNGKFLRMYEAPSSDVFEKDSIYKPIALAVDKSGRMYVVSSTTIEGIISLNADGSFSAFIGATKVEYDPLELLWKKFQTAAQRAMGKDYVSCEFNNIAMDDDGFMFITTSLSNQEPIKRINSSGDDIMRRNGFFKPNGEVSYDSELTASAGAIFGPSKLVDVAVGPEQTYSELDQERSKIYTYDKNGNELFIFGDKGSQLGNLQTAAAIAYQGDKMLILDSKLNTITIYQRTEYGNVIAQALKNTNDRKYDLAVDDWKNILQRNNNFDAAYVGIADSLYRQGKWDEAMKMYKVAYAVDDYSNAFKMYRKDVVSENILWVILAIVVFIWLVSLFFKMANKVNNRATLKRGKKTFWEEVLYAFHVQFHPFDGFWDLKHEKRGSVRGALFWLFMVVVSISYQAVGRSYIYNSKGSYTSIFVAISSIVIPLMLWCVANWCLTTLFDGEGSFKDIFIAASYAMSPLPGIVIFTTIFTHFISNSEKPFISLIIGIVWVWFALLLFFGMMVTHDYTLSKNVIITISTIVGMCVIMFIISLFSLLLVRMSVLIAQIITELSFRM